MSNVVIVALPCEDEKVLRLSSEKMPHLTLVSLGDLSDNEDAVVKVVEFVEHACKELSPFGMSVDYRGKLGIKDADVLFFDETSWNYPRIKSFRAYLLQNDAINRGVLTSEQFPEWVPHLTMGYPEEPAKEDTDEYPGISHVQFDRIAVWFGDFQGPEFRLKYDRHNYGSDMAMADVVEGLVLKHFGVKGMKWGVTTKDRAAQRTPTNVEVTQKKPGTFAKTKGGDNLPLHDDAAVALAARQKAKASTTDALSNADLRAAVERMQLEQRYVQLDFQNDRRSAGMRFVAGFFGQKRYTGKDLKFKDGDETAGERTRKAVETILEAKAAAK